MSTQLATAQRGRHSLGCVHCKQFEKVNQGNAGRGKRRHVASSTMITKNWRDFLRVDENKSELFHLVSQQVVLLPQVKKKSSMQQMEQVY